MGTKSINIHSVILNIYEIHKTQSAQNSGSAKGQQTDKKIGNTQWKETTLCADKWYMYETPKYMYIITNRPICQYKNTCKHI